MTLSDGIDLLYALMFKAQKNIDTKPDYYRPIYHLYYMVIYVAIQDAFNYGKVKSNSRHRAAYRWRNSKLAKQREDARCWLLNNPDCKKMWDDISDVGYEIFHQALNKAFEAFKDGCNDASDWNRHNRRSVEVGRRLKGLSI